MSIQRSIVIIVIFKRTNEREGDRHDADLLGSLGAQTDECTHKCCIDYLRVYHGDLDGYPKRSFLGCDRVT